MRPRPTRAGGVLKLIRGWDACSSHGPYAQVMPMCQPSSYWIRHCAGAVKDMAIWGCSARMSPALEHSTRRHAEAVGNQRGGLRRHGRKAVKA
ncbi:hypothetical protein XALC_2415 [Xanthomonas albilineans GPE PC73]|uniref:Uncharacterized protein n=1 Tax=Xanthomonas albilineans (strain GPE PC73 / CFBP 7063) TaxID=380358 RepID=D2UF34_XANAP|nr:hypothetical protein XALC_2415 [Xanthomonas albilineans GPE PC73]